MLNTGTYRTNGVIPAGPITFRFVADLLPMDDTMVLLKMPGSVILETIENSIRAYPALQGTFPSVSGCRFTFDASKEPGNRVVEFNDENDNPIDLEKEYTLATKYYIALGKDGWTALSENKDKITVIMNETKCPIVHDIVVKAFKEFAPNQEQESRLLDRRLKYIGSDKNERSDNGFIKITPKLDGRIKIIGEETI